MVTINAAPQRIMTQGSEAPVYAVAAGGADRVIARNSEFGSPLGEYAAALDGVPILGPNSAEAAPLSKEEIIAQRPDLVINRGRQDIAPGDLAEVGINAIITSGRCTENDSGVVADGSYEQIFSDVEKFGKVFGTEQEAAKTVSSLRERLRTIEESSKDRPQGITGAAIIFLEGGALAAYGSQATINSQLESLGLMNVFGDQQKRVFDTSIEELINRDPDVIVVITGDQGGTLEENKQKVFDRPELKGVAAVRDRKVISLPFVQTASSPLAIDGLEALARALDGTG